VAPTEGVRLVGLRAGGNPLDGAFDLLCCPRGERLVGVVVDLAAKAPADVRCPDGELVLRMVDDPRHQQPVDVGVLGGHRQIDLVVRGVVVRHGGAWLHRVRDEELVLYLEVDRVGRLLEGLLRLVGVADLPLECHVVRGVVVERRPPVQRVARIGDGLEAFVLDVDSVEGVVGSVPVLRDDDRDAVALVPDLLVGEDRVIDLFERLQEPPDRQTAGNVDVLRGKDVDDAVHRLRLRGVDVLDSRVGVLAPLDRHVGHPRDLDVVGVLRVAGDQCRVLAAFDRRPQNLCRIDLARVLGFDTHQSSPPAAAPEAPILSEAVSTALTMFW